MAIPRLVFTNGGRRLATVGGRTLVGRGLPVTTLTVAQLSIPNEGSPAVARVMINRTLLVPTVVTYATSNGTALAGTDYTPASGSTSIPAGQSYVDVSVPTTLRSGAQGDRAFTFTVTIATASGENVVISVGAATMTIHDTTAPAASTVAVENKTVLEGGTAQVRVTRDPANAVAVTFEYATSNGTALAGTDYTPASGTGTIPADATYVDIPVVTTLRSGEQAARAFSFTISAAMQGATPLTITNAVATVTINDTESSVHGFFNALSVHPQIFVAEGLRSPSDLNRLVEGRVQFVPSQQAAGSGIYYDPVTKISRSFQYVFPDDTLYKGAVPAGSWTPKDAARLYIDSSNTATSPYYDPEVPLLEKKPWHARNTIPREQVLNIPLNISSGKILVTLDTWYSRGWRFNRVDFKSQFKPFRFRFPGDSTFWSAHQIGGWPQSSFEYDGQPLYAESFGRIMNLLTTNDFPGTNPAGLTGKDPVYPGGLGTRTTSSLGHHWNFPFEVWVRHWFEIQLGQPHTAFTDWNTYRGVTLPPNPVANTGGLWNMVSSWVATPTQGPIRLLYKVPFYTNTRDGAENGKIVDFNFNYHTSEDWPTMTGPLVMYARNVNVLHNHDLAATPESDTTLFARPIVTTV